MSQILMENYFSLQLSIYSYILDGQPSPKLNSSEKEQAASKTSAASGSSLKRLRSSCVVIRMDDVDIHQASFYYCLI